MPMSALVNKNSLESAICASFWEVWFDFVFARVCLIGLYFGDSCRFCKRIKTLRLNVVSKTNLVDISNQKCSKKS